ncbi:MAG: hypothetical protein WCO78_03300 [Candidatus Roizmanbacteria bacterium]
MFPLTSSTKKIGAVILLSLLPILLVYAPFALHLKHFYFIDLKDSGLQQIYKNWDGPNYVLNAITQFDPIEIGKRAFMQRPNEYYAAHFPIYSWLIAPIGKLIGYFPAALVINLLSNMLLNIVFYLWIKQYSKHPLWLTFVLTVFPPRYWIVRSVISPEMLVGALILTALWKWERGYYFRAGLLALLAVMTKFQAIILMPVFFVTSLVQIAPLISHATCDWRAQFRTRFSLGMFFAILGPAIGYLIVGLYYQSTLGTFNAYFQAQAIVGMGASYPFGMFNYAARWIQTGWLEHTALYLVALFILVGKLWTHTFGKNGQITASDKNSHSPHPIYLIFTVLYTLMLCLIPQIDIMRLALPLAPLFIMAFHDFFESKPFRIGLILSLPMLYLYVLNFIMSNQAPISDWALF